MKPVSIHVYLIASLMLGSVLIAGAWTAAPDVMPPAKNVAAPLNIGTDAQTKAGALDVRALVVRGKGAFANGSAYTLPSSLAFGVNGSVGASQYCDAQGLNCFSATQIATLAAGAATTAAAPVSSWQTVPQYDAAAFSDTCEYKVQYNYSTWNYAVSVTPWALYFPPSGDSQVFVPNWDKNTLYVSPYGAWPTTITKIQKRC